MFFTEESLKQFCPTYQKAVLKFQHEYCLISGEDEDALKKRRKLILKFSENYLTPKEIWDEYFITLDKSVSSYERYLEHSSAIKESNILHFYFNDDALSFKNLKKRMIRYQSVPEYLSATLLPTDEGLRPRFTYPHLNLKMEYRLLAKYSASPITKEENDRYKYMKDLCEKIKDAEEKGDDDEKWFELLLKANNNKFVEHSIEYRLGKNLNNIKLWKIYMQFLKNQELKKNLLNLYSKYCRYFLDDEEMKEEYRNAVKNVLEFDNAVKQEEELSLKEEGQKNFHCVNWKNPFEFEKYVLAKMPSFQHLYENLSPALQETTNFIKPNFKCYHTQIFPFSKRMMDYILHNQSSQVLHKLHKCCKYFFAMVPFPVCHRFCCACKSRHEQIPYIFYSHSVGFTDLYSINQFNYNYYVKEITVNKEGIEAAKSEYANLPYNRYYGPNENFKFDNRLIISNSFNISSHNPSLLSYILKNNVYLCEAKYIFISNQNFTLDELKLLIGHGNTKHLNLTKTTILDSFGKLTPLEEILKLVPKITEFLMKDAYVTAETSKIMSELKFDNFIEDFRLFNVDLKLEPNGFLAFLKANFKPYFCVEIYFKSVNPSFAEFILNNYRNINEERNYALLIYPPWKTNVGNQSPHGKCFQSFFQIFNKTKRMILPKKK